MEISEVRREGKTMWAVETDFYRLLVLPEQARVLEVRSKATDRQLLAWWPMHLDAPNHVGGLGPLDEAARLDWRRAPSKGPTPAAEEVLVFEAEGPARLSWTMRYLLAGPELAAELSCAWGGAEDEEAVPPLARLGLAAEALPGSGGAMPREGTGFLHGRHKLLLFHHELYSDNLAVGDQPVPLEFWGEPFARFHHGPLPLEWAALIDTALREGVCLFPEGGWAEVGNHAHGLTCRFAVAAERLIGDRDRVSLGFAALQDVFHVDWAGRDLLYTLDTERVMIWPGAHEIPLRIVDLRRQRFRGRVEVELHGMEDLGYGRDADHETSARVDMTARLVWDSATIAPGQAWAGRVRVPPALRRELTIAPREELWGSFYARGHVQALDPSGAPVGEEEKFDIIRAISAEPGRAGKDLRTRAKAAADKLPREARSKAAVLEALPLRLGREQDRDARIFAARRQDVEGQLAAAIAHPSPGRRFYSEADLACLREMSGELDLPSLRQELRARLAEEPPWTLPVHREYGSWRVYEAAEAALHGAILYAITDDPQLAELAERRLAWFAGFWDRFGTVQYETIHNSIVAAPLLVATDLLSSLGRLSRDTEVRCWAYFTDIAEKIVAHQNHGSPLSNWKAMEYMTPALVGALCPYLPSSREWLRQAGAVLDRLLGLGCYADGAFWEMSVGYHLITMWALTWIGEALLRAAPEEGGREVFTTRIAGRRLADMAKWAARLTVAPGHGPRFHDSDSELRTSWLMNVAKRSADEEAVALARAAGWRMTLDDLLVPLAPPPGEPAVLRSFATEPSGKLVLRSGDATLILNFGPHTGGHCHYNLLTFELHAGGRCLVPDSGSYRYEESLHWDWFKATQSHNTVTLGERTQQEASGELLFFEETEEETRAGVVAPAYPGVRHERRLSVRGGRFTIGDVLTGPAASQDEYVWRLNSFEEFELGEGSATTHRGESVLRVEWDGDLAASTEPVSLMPDRDSEGPPDEPGPGWQLRLVQPATERVEFRVRLVT